MERLWSPWRSIHVAAWSAREEADRTGVFTRLATSDDDERDFVLWRGESVFVVMNLYPYNNGHLMIAPYRQVASYEDLTQPERYELADATDLCLRCLRTALAPDGFNVGLNLGPASGAGIPNHLHLHVVPRWTGDTNFMASTADVRVVPEAMRDTYLKLRRALEASP